MKYQRELLKDVEGYVPGEQPKTSGVIKLNTNENPYTPSEQAMAVLHALSPHALRKYSDPLSVEFRTVWAERYGYDGPDWVIAGNGMDELLSLAIRGFVDPGDAVLSTYPTYTLYDTLAQLHGARLKAVDLDEDFQLTDAFFETPARICFLPRPNSPSGVCCPLEVVERLCRGFDGLVVIDEAYADFADDNCIEFPKRFENAVVMRTFSKSFSLAGMRVGAGAARPEVVRELMKVKDSYNLNAVSQAVGLAALRDYGHMLANVEKVRATRARLIAALTAMGFRVPPSQSNFVLAQWDGTPNARAIFETLRECGILVRYFTARRLDNALRITVGTDDEINQLLQALRDIIEG